MDKESLQGGYVLLEVVIALVLMGVMIHGSLSLLTRIREVRRRVETYQKQERLLRAIASYAILYGRLPWAASRTASPLDQGNENSSMSLAQGIVPFKTLGISEGEAKDGFGHTFGYAIAVTRPAALTVSPLENYCRAYPVRPLFHPAYPLDMEKDFIVVALISQNPEEAPYLLESSERGLHLPEILPAGVRIVWATRALLVSLYGQVSCAPFVQPFSAVLEETGPLRGYGR